MKIFTLGISVGTLSYSPMGLSTLSSAENGDNPGKAMPHGPQK